MYRIFFIVFFLLAACNKRFFVNQDHVIKEAKGVFFFADCKFHTQLLENGEKTYLDSCPLPDFFIPMQLSGTECKTELLRILNERKEWKCSQFMLLNDCNFNNRYSYIKNECDTFIYNYGSDLHKLKFYILPVSIKYYEIKSIGVDEVKTFMVKDDFENSIVFRLSDLEKRVIHEAVIRDISNCR